MSELSLKISYDSHTEEYESKLRFIKCGWFVNDIMYFRTIQEATSKIDARIANMIKRYELLRK